MGIELGPEVESLTVPIFPGAAYFIELGISGEPFMPGESLALVFADGTVWQAAITDYGTTATFTASAASGAARLAAPDRSVWLRYTDTSGYSIPWAVGQVVRGRATS